MTRNASPQAARPCAALRIRAVWLLMVLWAVCGHAQAAAQNPQAAHSYHIAAQPLDKALTEVAAIGRIDILYENNVVDGLRSPGVSGDLTPRQAMAAALEGTGLTFEFTSPNAVLVFPANRPLREAAPSPSEIADGTPRMVLDTLSVTAAPLIGSSAPQRNEAYGRLVLTEVRRKLQNDERTGKRAFLVKLSVQIDSAGVIRQPVLTRRTGDPSLDADILRVLEGTQVSSSPPEDLPQPVWFEVSAQ